MDHLVNFPHPKQLLQDGSVGDIALHKVETPGQRLNLMQVAPFQVRIIKRVEIAHRVNGVAGMKQPPTHMRADKSRSARDQKIHARKANNAGSLVKARIFVLSLWTP